MSATSTPNTPGRTVAVPHPVSRRRAVSLGAIGRYLLALLLVLFVLAPIALMVSLAFQTTATAGSGQLVPTVWHWQTFVEMWQTIPLATYLKNSIIIATITGLFASLLGMGAGYVVGRFKFRFRELFRGSLLATHLIPGVLVLLPLFVMFVLVQQALHVTIIGSYLGVIVTYMTFALPFAIWLSSIYVASLPAELEDAAMIDGATRFQVLRYVVFPLSLPGLVVTFIFAFLLAWNDVLFASVMTSPDTRTLGVGLQYYLAENYSFPRWNELMAASLVSAIPAAILFFLVQRYLVAGLASGGVKG